MELWVLKVIDAGKAKKVMEDERVKKAGAVLRESLGNISGPFLVIRADKSLIDELISAGTFEIPENMEELKKIVEEEEEKSVAGVNLLGL